MNNMEKFMLMIKPYPYVNQFWVKPYKSYEVEVDRLKKFLKVCSSGEKVMLQFFAQIFTQNDYGFNLVEAGTVLHPDDLKIISDWIKDPFFP